MIYDDILRMNVPSLDNFLIFPLFLIIWECLTHFQPRRRYGGHGGQSLAMGLPETGASILGYHGVQCTVQRPSLGDGALGVQDGLWLLSEGLASSTHGHTTVS